MAGKERAGDNQKLKMLYLLKIFSEETDDLHPLTMPEIISKLAAYGVNANRKTLYLDFEELRNFGVDIISNKVGHDCYYNIGSRDFELPELKLLVDSVQSSKFITDRKSTELIKKLESLVSKYEGKQLQRQVVISGRVKAMNESIYYNVDKLHEAIGAGCQIRFKYYQWNVDKQMELRKNGDWYQVSPWALMWDDEYYYLVAFDAGDGKIKHYRVDKMLSISVTKEKRLGQEQFKRFDMPPLHQKPLRHVRRRAGQGHAGSPERHGGRHHRPLRKGHPDRPGGQRALPRERGREHEQPVPGLDHGRGRRRKDRWSRQSSGKNARRGAPPGRAVRRVMVADV